MEKNMKPPRRSMRRMLAQEVTARTKGRHGQKKRKERQLLGEGIPSGPMIATSHSSSFVRSLNMAGHY